MVPFLVNHFNWTVVHSSQCAGIFRQNLNWLGICQGSFFIALYQTRFLAVKEASLGIPLQALAVSRDGSAFRQVIEQPRLPRLQRPLLLTEEIRLRLARALAFERVAIERVVGDFLAPGFQQVRRELVGVDASERVIHEVLQWSASRLFRAAQSRITALAKSCLLLVCFRARRTGNGQNGDRCRGVRGVWLDTAARSHIGERRRARLDCDECSGARFSADDGLLDQLTHVLRFAMILPLRSIT